MLDVNRNYPDKTILRQITPRVPTVLEAKSHVSVSRYTRYNSGIVSLILQIHWRFGRSTKQPWTTIVVTNIGRPVKFPTAWLCDDKWLAPLAFTVRP
jgi:hypothetical protein